LPEKVAMSGVISTVIVSSWDRMARTLHGFALHGWRPPCWTWSGASTRRCWRVHPNEVKLDRSEGRQRQPGKSAVEPRSALEASLPDADDHVVQHA